MSLSRISRCLFTWDVGLSVAERERVERDVLAFVRAEIALAPGPLRLAITVLGSAFSIWMAFASMVGKDSETGILLWSRVAGTPGKMLVRLLRSLAILAYGEHPIVRARLGEPAIAVWQNTQRLARVAKVK